MGADIALNTSNLTTLELKIFRFRKLTEIIKNTTEKTN